MLENPIFLLGISTFFASIPVAIWLYLIFRKGEKARKIIILVFLLGTLTAPALLGMQFLWQIFPQFDLAAFIEENIQVQNRMFIAMFVLFAALEEIFKMYVVILIDKRTVLIRTIGDSIRYSIASALAFSFIENIYYLTQFWAIISIGELVGMYIFRSMFTMAAHMIFSGIFGYYYGIGKFSMYLTEQEKIIGKKHRIAKVISKIFKLPTSQGYQQEMIIKGLIIAIGTHATFNYLLQFNIILPVIIFVIVGYSYLRYLMKRKAGHLLLDTDISEKTKSTLAKKDEDVVVELLGMWFNDSRYVDVIHICERLLERDPDNTVVKLFKAKALDKMDKKDIYYSILGKTLRSKDEMTSKEKNVIAKHLEEKEILRQVQQMIRKQMKKEGKKYKSSKKKKKIVKKEKEIAKTHRDVLEKYTGEGEFKL